MRLKSPNFHHSKKMFPMIGNFLQIGTTYGTKLKKQYDGTLQRISWAYLSTRDINVAEFPCVSKDVNFVILKKFFPMIIEFLWNGTTYGIKLKK